MIAEFLKLLNRERVVLTAIMPGEKKIVRSEQFTDVEQAIAWARVRNDEGFNLYYTVNPMRDLADKIAVGKRASGEDAERVFAFKMDIDPVRPKDTMATDAEKEAMQERVLIPLVTFLRRNLGVNATVVDSGNEYNVLVRLDPMVEPTKEFQRTCDSLMDFLAAKFDALDAAVLDTSVKDLPRVLALPGTMKRKGENTTERPHREVQLVDAGEPVPPEKFIKFAAHVAEVWNDRRIQRWVKGLPRFEEFHNGKLSLTGFLKKQARLDEVTALKIATLYTWLRGEPQWDMEAEEFDNERMVRETFEKDDEEISTEHLTDEQRFELYRVFEIEREPPTTSSVVKSAIMKTKSSVGKEDGFVPPTSRLVEKTEIERRKATTAAALESVKELSSTEVDALSKLHKEVPYTDAGNAEYFAAIHTTDLRYVIETNRWIYWDGRRWKEDSSKKLVLGLAERAMRMRLIEIANGAVVDKKELNLALTALSERKLNAIITLAGARLPVSYYALNSKSYLLNARNGTIDLRTGERRPHDPNDFLTLLAGVDYNPKTECPRFIKFWEEVLPELDIHYLKRWFGYCMTGENREKKMHIWEGKRGNNGKSTIKNLLLHVFGDYAIEVSISVFIGKNRDYKNDDLVRLKEMRLVFAAEPEDGAILNSSLIKRLTGMDRIHCRPLHSNDWINYEPKFKPIILTNHELRVYDTDDAFWRRPELVRFNQVFEGANDNKLLIDELRAESEGVLAWLVAGAKEWYENGLLKDPVVDNELAQYRTRQDTFGDFVDSYIAGEVMSGMTPPSPRWPVLSSTLRTFYNNWAAREGFKPIGKPKFKEQMEQHGFINEHRESGAFWHPADDTRMYKSIQSSIELTIPRKTDDNLTINAITRTRESQKSKSVAVQEKSIPALSLKSADDTDDKGIVRRKFKLETEDEQ